MSFCSLSQALIFWLFSWPHTFYRSYSCCSWRAPFARAPQRNSVDIHEKRKPQSWVEKSVGGGGGEGGWLSPWRGLKIGKTTSYRSVSTQCSLSLIFPLSLTAYPGRGRRDPLTVLVDRNKCIVSQIFRGYPLSEDLGSCTWRHGPIGWNFFSFRLPASGFRFTLMASICIVNGRLRLPGRAGPSPNLLTAQWWPYFLGDPSLLGLPISLSAHPGLSQHTNTLKSFSSNTTPQPAEHRIL